MEPSNQSQSDIEEFLEKEIQNREAVISIMELFDVDEKTAIELWVRFIETVDKIKERANKSGGA